MTIGSLIPKRRVELGLTQTALSDLLGVSVWSIHQWESGRARPRQFRKQVADWLSPIEELAQRSATGEVMGF